MCRIPHTRRRDGRYIFRRRVHYRNIISLPLGIALGTADPKVARVRAAMLSARFMSVKTNVDAMLETGPALTGEQIEGLFRDALEHELRSLLNDAHGNAPWSDSVPDVASEIAEASRILRRPNRPYAPVDGRRDAPPEPGENSHLDGPAFYAAQILANLGDEQVAAMLSAIGAPVHAGILETARTHIIRGMGKGAELARRAFDDEVLDAPDPLKVLTANLGPKPTSMSANIIQHPMASANATITAAAPNNPFVIFDSRPFSAAIDDIVAELKAEGIWSGDCAQQRRIMQTFAWITGDKPLGAYTHLDVAAFKKALLRIPVNFSFGTLEKGTMAQPFVEIAAELPAMTDATRRNPKTINRDLSFLQTVSKHLSETCWKSRNATPLVLDFGAARLMVKGNGDDLRPPWRRAHLECLFASPIYTGNDGAKQRLKANGSRLVVQHDAAYFAPLLWYYTAACREEICGLEVADVIGDYETPYLHIQDNMTRGHDGEKAGEKRAARNRRLPIPRELIRLGFLDYVHAIAAEGHTALFPECYVAEKKRGGAFFYERAWRHMVDYIADQMLLPPASNGKGADIHSIRALGSSFYEVDGVNEILRADVMGHARTGTNAKHYSKRELTEGLEVILRERLSFIERYVPVITDRLRPAPIRLLPIELRTRTGSSRARKKRSDAKNI
ncbi:MAG: hypothetical protein OSB00_09455 [Sphingomonas bacterium]|nr:hypothetical protein [Sphingomonas bacterium]